MARRNDSTTDLVITALMSNFRSMPWWAGLVLIGMIWLVMCFALPFAFDLFAGSPPPDATRDDKVRETLFGTFATLLRAFRWLFLGMLLLLWVVALAAKIADGRRLDSQQSIHTIRTLPWREFELLLAEHFRRVGYHVETTPDGADGGVDLILHKDGRLTLVQAKQWRTERVGVTKVRELFGIQAARHAAESILITSGRFTPEARAFADESGVRLIDGNELEPIILDSRRPAAPSNRPITLRPAPAATPRVEATPAESPSSPPCPKCGSPMAQRTARQGPRAGSKFWGCTKYPACKGIVNID